VRSWRKGANGLGETSLSVFAWNSGPAPRGARRARLAGVGVWESSGTPKGLSTLPPWPPPGTGTAAWHVIQASSTERDHHVTAASHHGWIAVTAGWRLEHVGYVFHETGSVSRDKMLSTGQTATVTGETWGIYVFAESDSESARSARRLGAHRVPRASLAYSRGAPGEQEAQGVEMPEGMERHELALRILVAAEMVWPRLES
jgi:hypothetical protein